MSSTSSLPRLPRSGVSLPNTPLVRAALEHSRKYTSPTTVNHCIRSAYFAVLLSRKIPHNSAESLDVELIVVSTILHDLGWATDKSLLSKDTRFEVDGANMARSYVEKSSSTAEWDKYRTQLLWDSIALHADGSFARHKQPEVVLVYEGISADFQGPNYPGGYISVEEYKEIVGTFPRLGFKDQFVEVMCGLCALKPETTYGNFVGDWGVQFGLDGKGTGREEFKKERLVHRSPQVLGPALTACAVIDAEIENAVEN